VVNVSEARAGSTVAEVRDFDKTPPLPVASLRSGPCYLCDLVFPVS
jgi:hypothetical protein